MIFQLYCKSCIRECHWDQLKQRQIVKTNKIHAKQYQTQAKGDKIQTHRTTNTQEIQHSLAQPYSTGGKESQKWKLPQDMKKSQG